MPRARDAGLFHGLEPEYLALGMSTRWIGLMSGTSLDGVDGVVASFDPGSEQEVSVVAHAHQAFGPALRAELMALNAPGADELHRAALAANGLARAYAEVVSTLLAQTGGASDEIVAIGAHGQTVRHRPGEFDGIGYTWQLNAPALLAELTGIDVVADFRSRDVAARGQGAPLVPAFHRAMFAREGESIAVLNLGGMANLTVLGGDGTTTGFDCGPGNALMDGWCALHTGRAYDVGGEWGAVGRVDDRLLDAMLAEPYFALRGPKSTGRDLFNSDWLARHLAQPLAAVARSPTDVQATLVQLTARVCATAFEQHADSARELIVCGGGAFNADLMRRLALLLPHVHVVSSASRGLPPDQVEATAFAWLARANRERQAGNVPAVTGAAGGRVLGALYPGAPIARLGA